MALPSLSETMMLQDHLQCTCQEADVTIVDATDKHITVMIIDPDQSLPPEGVFSVKTVTQDPQAVATQLAAFWNQFWQRDTSFDIDQPPVTIGHWQAEPPDPINMTFDDADALRKAKTLIRKVQLPGKLMARR